MNRSIRGMVAAIWVNAEELVPPEGLLFGDHSVLLVGCVQNNRFLTVFKARSHRLFQ
jgi:hypothetical protein